MSEETGATLPIRVVVIADVESNATALVENVLRPAGIQAWTEEEEVPETDILLVDITQLMGDPLAGLRTRRSTGDDTPALILAARFPQSRLRDFFRLGVADILLKPYRPHELLDAIRDLAETRAREANTKILARKLESSREHVRQRGEEIRLLSDIGRAVVSLRDLDRILMRVAEAAAFVTDAEEANIYLTQGGEELILRASKQAGERHATKQRIRVNDTLVGQVFRTGQPLLRQPSSDAGPLKIQTGFLVRSLIHVPIRVQKIVTGVLGVYNRLASRPFNEHHLTLLMSLADWAGVAIEHAHLVQQAEAVTAELPPLVHSSLDTSASFEEALTRLENLLDGDQFQFSDQQLAAMEGLRLTLMRGVTSSDQPMGDTFVDLPNLVRDVIEKLAPEAERKKIELSIGPSLPIEAFEGKGQPIHQVIGNLVSAAINRTAQGRIVLNIHRFEVESGTADGLSPPEGLILEDGIWHAVTVADSSQGLTVDSVRALTSDEVDPSAGILGPGLSMGEIRLIAESIGGFLWHDQSPTGTTIVFAIPISE
ncbi:MAG: GAF domain-containing protein [Anaerolineales bacterium]|nr:GAF domain-containing protein [Anaerolineales bacterium]